MAEAQRSNSFTLIRLCDLIAASLSPLLCVSTVSFAVITILLSNLKYNYSDRPQFICACSVRKLHDVVRSDDISQTLCRATTNRGRGLGRGALAMICWQIKKVSRRSDSPYTRPLLVLGGDGVARCVRPPPVIW